jgi:HEAT repeat protein
LRDLLKKHDAFFYYGAVGENTKPVLRAIWVYPRGAGATFQPVPPEAWASTKDLAASLSATDPTLRERAYEALMSRPDSESRDLVLHALRGASETDPDMRQRLLSSALSRGIEIPRELLADLVRGDSAEEVRLMALDAFSGDPSARDVAVIALSDPSEAVRARAKDLLVEIDARRRPR